MNMPFMLRRRLSANNPEYINFPGLKQNRNYVSFKQVHEVCVCRLPEDLAHELWKLNCRFATIVILVCHHFSCQR